MIISKPSKLVFSQFKLSLEDTTTYSKGVNQANKIYITNEKLLMKAFEKITIEEKILLIQVYYPEIGEKDLHLVDQV